MLLWKTSKQIYKLKNSLKTKTFQTTTRKKTKFNYKNGNHSKMYRYCVVVLGVKGYCYDEA